MQSESFIVTRIGSPYGFRKSKITPLLHTKPLVVEYCVRKPRGEMVFSNTQHTTAKAHTCWTAATDQLSHTSLPSQLSICKPIYSVYFFEAYS